MDRWSWAIEDAGSLALVRRELRDRASATVEAATHVAPSGPLMASPVERVLLVFSELATNGLRHGVPPVGVGVSRTRQGWLVVVSDGNRAAGPHQHQRDPTRPGQHGMIVVDTLCAAVGWYTDDAVKHVWAVVPDVPPAALLTRLEAS